MYVEKLALKDFRNYESLDTEFSPGINVLWGDNAQGKTNILESIYMCATSKSHRGSRDHEMIRFGQKEAHIRSVIVREEVRHRIDIHLRRGSAKGIAVDSMPIRRSGQLFGTVHIVCFSPEDLSMIKNGPSQRRRFMDLEMCQLNNIYLHDLSRYNKAVNQRNSLLKQIPFDRRLEDTLDVWDMQLMSYGSKVIEQRGKFLKRLDALAGPIHEKLTGGREKLRIIYQPSCDVQEFEQRLMASRETDLKMKTTGVGPHRDDFSFIIDGIDVRKFGSQGQQRTAALSLKLAEIELVKKKINDNPVLLLDDVLSELDAYRQKDLLASIRGIQSIITCTGIEDFPRSSTDIDRMYKIVAGHIEK